MSKQHNILISRPLLNNLIASRSSDKKILSYLTQVKEDMVSIRVGSGL